MASPSSSSTSSSSLALCINLLRRLWRTLLVLFRTLLRLLVQTWRLLRWIWFRSTLRNFRRLFVASLLLGVLWYTQRDQSLRAKVQRWTRARNLPSFAKGGVVIFYHTVRTGGTTIQKNFYRPDRGILLKHPSTPRMFEIANRKIEGLLQGNTSTLKDFSSVIVDLHGELATLAQIGDDIERWRQMAHDHGTPLFVFTLVREPVAFHVSYFNQFRLAPCERDDCEPPFLNATVEDLLTSIQPNDQCHRITHQHGDKFERVSHRVTQTECEEAYQWLRQHMDWIGTTEQLHQDTLPILAQLFLNEPERAWFMNIYNDQTKANKLSVDSLSWYTQYQIRQLSPVDQWLYDRVRADYSLGI